MVKVMVLVWERYAENASVGVAGSFTALKRPRHIGRFTELAGRTCVRAKDRASTPIGRAAQRPLLLVDIDGVLSLFGPGEHGSATAPEPAPPGEGSSEAPVSGSFHAIDGIPHFLSSTAAAHLLSLEPFFDLVWASGWEEKANEHLPRLLGLPESLPFLRFARPGSGAAGAPAQGDGGPQVTHGHWKLESIDTYACGRPLAWIDDALSPVCHEWAAARPAPTLLVQTVPEQGLTEREARLLEDWARALPAA